LKAIQTYISDVIRWPVTAEAWTCQQGNPCGICGGKMGLSPSTSVICCHHSTKFPYLFL